MFTEQRNKSPLKRLRWSAALLLAGFLLGSLLPSLGREVRAAPRHQASFGDVVISEFRTSGPDGGYDEFIEIFNRTNAPVDMGDWEIRRSSSGGSKYHVYDFPSVFSLEAGQYYLIAGSSYSGSVEADDGDDIKVADNGGLALLDDIGTIIDAVGMDAGSAYLEGDPLAPLSGSSDHSYFRMENGCTDTDDNDADFFLQSPSDPQNSTSIPIKCLKVVNVTSTTVNGIYQEDDSIVITVQFSSNVNVTGFPTLLLETGITDRNAIYSSGSGSDTLTFNYTVQNGDVSDDLDYVATDSLSLNGGSIVGAVGDADLTLPEPGQPDSLGANKDIIIDNQIPPELNSFTRYDPSAVNTNADLLVFRATFSEPVTNVDTLDFSVTGTTAGVSSVVLVNSSVYEVTVSGGDLAALNGTVGLDLSGVQDITDAVGMNLPNGEPTTDETYTLDNIAPTVTINQATGQADPENATPIEFTVVFSEEIDISTFTVDDITQNGTVSASLITWRIADSGDHTTFTLYADRIAENGTVSPSIAANQVTDLAGNGNEESASTDNTVTFSDDVRPTVTINQASGQSDPASTLPIEFAVSFSEPIIASIFTTADITQSGTATGITWSIINLGDDQNFTLRATAVTGAGTLIPSIAENRVTDIVGNNNLASTSTDNEVRYTIIPSPTVTKTPTTPTKTPTPYPFQSVVLNEVLPRPGRDWNGDGVVNTDDEFIEIINRGGSEINLRGWKLDDEYNSGSDAYTLPSFTLRAGERIAIFGYTSRLLLSDGGDTVRLLKPNGQVADVVTYTVVKAPDLSWCRFPENGFWNTNCFPTPNKANALNGDFVDEIPESVGVVCSVPDTVPERILLIECGILGMQINDEEFWERELFVIRLTGNAKYVTWFH